MSPAIVVVPSTAMVKELPSHAAFKEAIATVMSWWGRGEEESKE